jgi:PEP-CTERM motif
VVLFFFEGRIMLHKAFALTAATLFAGISIPAIASVPGASGFYRLEATGDPVDAVQFDATPLLVSDAYTTISVLGQPQPAISIASVRGSPSRQSTGTASLTYFFRFQAADAEAYNALLDANAFLNFAGISTITDTRTGQEGFFSSGQTALGIIAGRNALTDVEYLCGNFRSDIGGCGTQSFSFDHAVSNFAEAETLSFFGTIRLFASSQNGGDGVQVDQSSAFIDPIITLNTGRLDPSRYTLQLSNGIGNGVSVIGGVPEPSAWALMLAGFGIAGGALRRKSRALPALA